MNNFTFYNNYYEIIKYLNDEDRLALYDAIFNYMFEDKEPNFEGLKKGIWINIKMPLDTSKVNYNNGKKGGRPKTEKKPKQNPKETEIKSEVKPKGKANNISYFLFLISNNKYIYINNNNIILINKIKEWLEYKQERKELYKETGLKSLLTEIENNIKIYGIDNIIELINTCMANNYKGIIFDKLKNQERNSQQKVDVPKWFNKDYSEKNERILTEEDYERIRKIKETN